MTGEECKFLHPAPCRKYIENPERSCRAQCKGYHPELRKYSRAQRNVTTVGALEYISRAQFASKPHIRPRYQVQLPELRINNKLCSPHKIWLTTASTLVNTPQPAYHRHSPCPLTNSLPYPTPYAISHHPSDYRFTVP